MTYLQFLLLFVCLPIAILSLRLFLVKAPGPDEGAISPKAFVKATLVLVALAVVYTTPWDNYLVMHKIWWYGPDRVLGTISYVPIEEYAFFVLQTLLTCLWGYSLYLRRHRGDKPALIPAHNRLTWPLTALWDRDELPIPAPDCWPSAGCQPSKGKPLAFYLVLAVYLALFGLGVYGLGFASPSWRYLGLILAWSMPVAILQWVLGGEHLLVNGGFWGWMMLPPTVYLWFADAFAIDDGIWTISQQFTLGLKVGELPLEEAAFFAVTNLMVSQGLILFVLLLPMGFFGKRHSAATLPEGRPL